MLRDGSHCYRYSSVVRSEVSGAGINGGVDHGAGVADRGGDDLHDGGVHNRASHGDRGGDVLHDGGVDHGAGHGDRGGDVLHDGGVHGRQTSVHRISNYGCGDRGPGRRAGLHAVGPVGSGLYCGGNHC